MDHVRIDEGISRRPAVGRVHNPDTGQIEPAYPPDQRDKIIEDALASLQRGDTTDQIAARYDIDGSTLRRWLLVDNRANDARSIYFGNELNDAREKIKTSGDPFTLAL